jgi:hypothetical protein
MSNIELFKDNRRDEIKQKLTHVEDQLNELYRLIEENSSLDDDTYDSYLKLAMEAGLTVKELYTDIY